MRILVIEDDRKAAALLARGLREEGFAVDVAHSARDGDAHAFVATYDVIVLDWLLPDRDGVSLCRALRARRVHTPILLLTACDGLSDRVSGLDAGADDYVTKPFAFEELLARIRALLRRSDMMRPVVLTYADVAMDPISRRVTRAGQDVDLTPKEYAILEVLLRHAGEVVNRARLAERIWEADAIALDNLIDVHISNLRRKVDAGQDRPLIHTIRGRGFRLCETTA
ncbi:MAG TPA: response regulator transcription factor [Pseudomonadales bacterium]|nr:response regulator transcription factor [Pseudomonadales bacterium]